MPARKDEVLMTEPLGGAPCSMNGMPCLQLSQVVVRLAAMILFQTSGEVFRAERSPASTAPALL